MSNVTTNNKALTDAEKKKEALSKRLGKNLTSLHKYMGWSKSVLAQEIGVSGSSITNYTSGNRMLPTEALDNIRNNTKIKRKINLSVDDMFLENEDFRKKLHIPVPGNPDKISELKHKDFVGNYFLYLFDQSKTESEQIHLADRDMIFGVITVYSEAGDGNTLSAYARFYTEKERKEAVAKKDALDKLIKENKSFSEIMEAFSDERSYSGTMTFSGRNVFVSLDNIVFKDSALLIFPVPNKPENVDYTGGLGCICSISHGNHMPVAQKVVISRKQLEKADDEIRSCLMMSSASVSTSDEGERLLSLIEKFYVKDENNDFPLNELDINAIITKRLNQFNPLTL